MKAERVTNAAQGACEGCGGSLADSAHNAKFCCAKCRYAVKRKRHPHYEVFAPAYDGPCADCGTREGRLVLHHLDPATKTFNVGQTLRTHTRAEVEAEIAKCVLLCDPCHGARHGSGGVLA